MVEIVTGAPSAIAEGAPITIGANKLFFYFFGNCWRVVSASAPAHLPPRRDWPLIPAHCTRCTRVAGRGDALDAVTVMTGITVITARLAAWAVSQGEMWVGWHATPLAWRPRARAEEFLVLGRAFLCSMACVGCFR